MYLHVNQIHDLKHSDSCLLLSPSLTPFLCCSLSLYLSPSLPLSEPQAASSDEYLMSAITKMEATLQAFVHERKSAHSNLFSPTWRKKPIVLILWVLAGPY